MPASASSGPAGRRAVAQLATASIFTLPARPGCAPGRAGWNKKIGGARRRDLFTTCVCGTARNTCVIHGPGAAREQRGDQMRRGADALRGLSILPRLALGIGDQLADRVGGEKSSAHGQHDQYSCRHHAASRPRSARIEAQVLVQPAHAWSATPAAPKAACNRVGLGRRRLGGASEGCAASAHSVLDDERLAPARAAAVVDADEPRSARIRPTPPGAPRR